MHLGIHLFPIVHSMKSSLWKHPDNAKSNSWYKNNSHGVPVKDRSFSFFLTRSQRPTLSTISVNAVKTQLVMTNRLCLHIRKIELSSKRRIIYLKHWYNFQRDDRHVSPSLFYLWNLWLYMSFATHFLTIMTTQESTQPLFHPGLGCCLQRVWGEPFRASKKVQKTKNFQFFSLSLAGRKSAEKVTFLKSTVLIFAGQFFDGGDKCSTQQVWISEEIR